MSTSVHVNEFVLFDDMTPYEIVEVKIAELVRTGTIAGEFAALCRCIKGDLWKMTYQDIYDFVKVYESDDLYNPFVDAMFFGTDVCYGGSLPVEEEYKEYLGIHDWSTRLAEDIADRLINTGMNVIVDNTGDETDGMENCSVIILHKKTLAKTGVGKAVNELVDEIGKRQAEIRRETGVSLAPVRVFIHEGDLESLEVLGKPVVPLRLV